MAKRFSHLVDAVMFGTKDPAELPEEMLELVVAEAERRQAVAAADERKAIRDSAAREAAHLPVFRASTFFVATELLNPFGPVIEELRAIANRTTDRSGATIFIVKSPLSLCRRDAWACALSGSAAVTFEYACTGGESGLAVQYDRYAARRRVCYMTPAFEAAHPTLPPIIRGATPNWQHIDEATLVATKGRYEGARRAELVVLCAKSEVGHRPASCEGVRYFLPEACARNAITKINRACSKLK